MAGKTDRGAAAETILAGIADGKTLTTLLAAPGMPKRLEWRRWLDADKALAARNATALELSAGVLVDRAFQVLDEIKAGTVTPEAGKVAIDAYLWVASKRDPKVYGDRRFVEVNGTVSASASPTEAMASGVAAGVGAKDAPAVH